MLTNSSVPKHPWVTLDSEYVLDVPWLRVRRDICQLADGTVLDDYYVWEGRDWVAVFALTSEGTILLVRQYRQAVKEFVWELPGGVVDPGEEVVAAALRELREETGFSAERGELVARMSVDPPKATFSNYLVLARDCRRAGPQALDQTEAIEISSLSPAALLDWVRRGRIWAMSSVACIYRSLDYLGLWPSGRGDEPRVGENVV